MYKRIAELFENKTPSLPVPFLNVINGGAHSGNLIAFQEFMVAPIGASNFEEAMKMGSEVYHSLKSLIKKKYGSYSKQKRGQRKHHSYSCFFFSF